MANDNTLGAPTEGLGQTVTFTSAGVAVPQTRAVRSPALRLAQQGGGEARLTARHSPLPDARGGQAVLDVFHRLGSEILAPRLKQARDDAYLTGMQRAASGEAIAEIVNEQPWYSKVFGEVPVVEGARAFSAYTRAQEEVRAIEEDMPNLRQRSPSEVQAIFSQKLSSVQTGDRGTDSLVIQSLMQEAPGIMRRHAKERIGWQQADMAQQWRGAQGAAAERLSATRARFDPAARAEALLNGGDPGSFADPGDMLEAEIAYVAAFAQPAGIPFETYDKLTTSTIGSLLSQKNLHAYYILDDAGIIDNLSPEAATRLRTAADRAEGRARSEMPPELIDELAKIKTLPALFDQEGINDKLSARVANLNRRYSALTGAREPLLSGSTVAELNNSLMEKQIAADRRIAENYAKANDKGLDEALKEQAAEQVIVDTRGAMVQGQDVSRASKDTRYAAWRSLHPDRQALSRARVLQYDQGERDTEGQGHLRVQAQQALATDNPGAWEQLYQQEYLPLVQAAGDGPDREKVALSYFGDDYGAAMSYYHSIRPRLKDDAQLVGAFVSVKQPRPRAFATGEDSLDRQALKAVGDLMFSWTSPTSWASSYNVRPELHKALTEAILPRIQRKGESAGIASRVASSLKDAQAAGLELGGGYFWQRGDGPSLREALNKFGDARLTTDNIDGAISTSVAALASSIGIQGPQVVYRQNNGVPSLLVMGEIEATGQWGAYPLAVADIHAAHFVNLRTNQEKAAEEMITNSYDITETGVRQRAALENVLKAVTTPQGPKRTFVPVPGAKSIYDY